MYCFNEIWTDYYPRLRVFARSFSGLSDSDREDCIQEIFLRVYQNLDRYDQRWSFSTWMYRIARNKLIDYQRRAVHHVVAEVDEDFPDRVDFEATAKANRRMDIQRAIGSLDDIQREVIYLYYSENFLVAEIASILGKPEGSIKSILHRSRRALKRQLEEAYASEG